MNGTEWERRYVNTLPNTSPFGYSDKTLSARMPIGMEIEQYMTSYRYLVVIAGMVGADRLNIFLAHSGAVILLQETDFLYHYSSLLKPWVHYGKKFQIYFYYFYLCSNDFLLYYVFVQFNFFSLLFNCL